MDAKKSQRIPLLTFFGTVTRFKKSQFVFFFRNFLKVSKGSPFNFLMFWHNGCLKFRKNPFFSERRRANSVQVLGFSGTVNQSRICGKGVGLSLFPSDSLSFESYEQFVRKSKDRKMTVFLAIFGLNLAMFLTSQPYEFKENAHKGP